MRRRTPSARLFAAVIGLVSCTFAQRVCAETVQVEDFFPRPRRIIEIPAAEDLVRTALDHLFARDVAIYVDGVTQNSDGSESRTNFWLYRKIFSEGRVHTFLAILEPAEGAGMRLLQIERGTGRMEPRFFRSWVYSPKVSMDPVRTEYRLTDPFLGTLSDESPANVRADLFELGRGFEILSRTPARLSGREADWIGLRALSTREYERVELLISRGQVGIIEYRFFELGMREPARIVSAPPQNWVKFEDRWLPGRLMYEDRLLGSSSQLQLRYEPLPEALGDAPFLDESFHRVAIPNGPNPASEPGPSERR